MQRTPKTIGLAILLLLSGLLMGVGVGLWIGIIELSDQLPGAGVATLEPQAKDDAILLTANTYSLDGDLYRAQERLDRLDDPDIQERIATLAMAYATRQDPAAARLARLDEDLGAQIPEIPALAHPATPTPSATITPIATSTPAATPTVLRKPTTATIGPAAARPTATRTPAPVPEAIPPQWTPAYPAGWPGGVKYQPANVAPGQKYWRLAKAIYCDSNDEHDYCQDLPGGPLGTDTYIRLLGEGGDRADAEIQVVDNNGTTFPMEAKAATDSCNCNYGYTSNGFIVQVLGAPSDTISGMALYSVQARRSNFHVRYFITFQLTTR